MHIQDKINTVYAGFFPRLAAYLVDVIIVGLALLTLRIPFWIVTLMHPDNLLNRPVLFSFSTWSILMYLITSAYFIAFTYISGATLGKRLFHLKVIDKAGEKLTLINVIYRETIGRFLSGLMCLGYILIAVDTEKRGLHDVLCDTRVIYTHIVIIPDSDEIPEAKITPSAYEPVQLHAPMTTDTTESDTTESETTESASTSSDSRESETVESVTAYSDSTESETVETDTTRTPEE